MSNRILVFSGSNSPRVRRAFLLIAAIAKTQWEIIGESFYVWVGDDTRTSVKQLADQFQLQSRLPSRKTEQGGTALQLLPTPEQRKLSFNLDHPVSLAIPVAKETRRRKVHSYLGKPIPIKSLLEEEKRGRSKKLSDGDLRKSLRKRGLEGTAKHYGVMPKTVKKWAKKVPGASDLIPDKERSKRKTR
ncbi:hypothetical protein IH982_03275 [Patescibacteria group bacterium]|nr:hypothetical protein [Patescibacteria group bacterium]